MLRAGNLDANRYLDQTQPHYNTILKLHDILVRYRNLKKKYEKL